MNFILFWIDVYFIESLYGFGIFQFKVEYEDHQSIRNLFAVYWNDGELLLDFLWFHILE